MANNRMRLRCDVCQVDFGLAKYYPRITKGWFVPDYPPEGMAGDDKGRIIGTIDYVRRLDEFLQAHSFCNSQGAPTMYGNRRFSLDFEIPDPEPTP